MTSTEFVVDADLERAYHALQRQYTRLLIDYWHAKAAETIAECEPIIMDNANVEAQIASSEAKIA